MKNLVAASLRHYRALHALVVTGVAVAVAVLAGALLVGGSVRASLRDLALARLGKTEVVVSSTSFFRDALSAAISSPQISGTASLLAVTGAVTHEDSGRTAARVQVFGIDDRFLAFHGLPSGAPAAREAWISSALAAELGVAEKQSLVLRVAKLTDVPLSHLQGRREDVSQRIRLSTTRVLGGPESAGPTTILGEFSLLPAQGPALSIFVPLARLQQDLDLEGSVNALLVTLTSPSRDPERDLTVVRDAVSAAVRPDDLGLKLRSNAAGTVSIIESRTGLLSESVWKSAAQTASESGRTSVGTLTYLANVIRAGDREIPYSLIAAIDLSAYERITDPSPPTPPSMTSPPVTPKTPHPPIRLNEWAAEDLGVVGGERIDIEYFLWSDQDGLQTKTASFTLVGTVPMSSAGGDSTLTPEYPGITDASDVTSWDPPFPVDLKRVRKKDEEYWDVWRAAPKAFVALEVGQTLWPSPFGTLSSLRTTRANGEWPSMRDLDAFASGLTARHARADALAAAAGTTDFGEYFIYFSFFIVVSGLLLAGMFFALSVEQRAKEIGLLMATGFGVRAIRRLLVGEAAVLAVAGSVVGLVGAIAYAAFIMYGLRTWWVDAVGTTALQLHVDPLLLIAGAAGALVAAIAALALSMRRISQRSARTLLTAGLSEDEAGSSKGSAVSRYIWMIALALAAVLVGGAAIGVMNRVAGFFGAGGLLLIAGCAMLASGLRRPRPGVSAAPGMFSFGASYARWRPTRSVLSAALIAFACFVIVSVGAFRRDPAGMSIARDSGTGGFALMAESVAPLMHNPNTAAGREELSLAGYSELNGTHIARFRLRPGDEASCLTLYQPKNPRLVAPEQSFLDEKRFAFAQTLAETDEERGNPWLLLNRTFADGAVATIADQTSLTYVFHLAVGDVFELTPDGGTPIRLRIVGTLADSVLQSELIIGERDFVRLFPQHEGYRVWMIEAPEANVPAVTTVLEDRLSDFGVDVTDTRARLASYHQVENTYLSTFQALGALGLLLGTIGLAAVLARNVLERRRELGLLGAVGFTPAHLRTMVTGESLLLVMSGVTIGTLAALVAIAPAIIERASALPFGGLALLLAAVIATGFLASLAAVRFATSVSVVEAIKTE